MTNAGDERPQEDPWVKTFDFAKAIGPWLRYIAPLVAVLGIGWAWYSALNPLLWVLVGGALAALVLAIVAAVLVILREIDTRRARSMADIAAEHNAKAFLVAVRMIMEQERTKPSEIKGSANLVLGPVTVTGSASITEAPDTLIAYASTQPYIPLSEAMRQAYELTRNGPLAEFAKASSETPNELLDWYAFAAFEHLPIYGKQPPSAQLDLVPIEDIASRLYFGGGAKWLKPTWEKEPSYIDLMVKPKDFSKFVSYLTDYENNLQADIDALASKSPA